MSLEIITSPNYVSVATEGDDYPWQDGDRANATVGGFAFTINQEVGYNSSWIGFLGFQDVYIPPGKELVGLAYEVNLVNLDGSAIVNVKSYLTLNADPKGPSLPVDTAIKSVQVNIDDGGGNQVIIPATLNDLWGIDSTLQGYSEAQLQSDSFGFACQVEVVSGEVVNNITVTQAVGYFYFNDIPSIDSTFRNRGGNRGRLLQGVR